MKKLLLVLSLIGLSAQADDEKLNRLKLLFGFGPNGTNVSQVGGVAVVGQNVGPLYGVEYDRKIDKTRFSLGGQFLSNNTSLISAGFDF